MLKWPWLKLCMTRIWLYCIFNSRIISNCFLYMHFRKHLFSKIWSAFGSEKLQFNGLKITLLDLVTLLLFGRVPQYLWSTSDLIVYYLSLDHPLRFPNAHIGLCLSINSKLLGYDPINYLRVWYQSRETIYFLSSFRLLVES